MKFQNCILINFVTDTWTDGQAQSNMPLQLFQSWGHKNVFNVICYNLGLLARKPDFFCISYEQKSTDQPTHPRLISAFVILS